MRYNINIHINIHQAYGKQKIDYKYLFIFAIHILIAHSNFVVESKAESICSRILDTTKSESQVVHTFSFKILN